MRHDTCFLCLHGCLPCRITIFILAGIVTIFVSADRGFGAGPGDLASRYARSSPQWVQRGVIYQIQPRAFTPEGTLKAATGRLPRLAELGVDILYLCPVFVSDDDPDTKGWSPRQRASGMNNPRNPYRMKDYYHVDPEYGTDADLKAFVTEAHRLDMRVLLDMVYLHCGPNAVFLEQHPDFVKRDKTGNIITQSWGFPAINFSTPKLREYFWKNMEYWITQFDVDGFRCDVSDQIPLDFWKTARERLEKRRPEICLLAEGIRLEDQLKAFDLNYSFVWFSTVRRAYEQGKPASSIRKVSEKLAAERPRGARIIRYIDNHDIANDAWPKRIETKWTFKGVNAALAMLFTLDGVPFLYNGQEVADTARHSIYARLSIDWANANTPAGKARFAFCKRLCAVRHAERALTDGANIWLDNDHPDSVLSFLRRTDREEVISVVNLSHRPLTVQVTLPHKTTVTYQNLLGETHVSTTLKGLTLHLQSFGFFVGKGR